MERKKEGESEGMKERKREEEREGMSLSLFSLDPEPV